MALPGHRPGAAPREVACAGPLPGSGTRKLGCWALPFTAVGVQRAAALEFPSGPGPPGGTHCCRDVSLIASSRVAPSARAGPLGLTLDAAVTELRPTSHVSSESDVTASCLQHTALTAALCPCRRTRSLHGPCPVTTFGPKACMLQNPQTIM